MIEWILLPFGLVLYGLAMAAAKGAELLDAIGFPDWLWLRALLLIAVLFVILLVLWDATFGKWLASREAKRLRVAREEREREAREEWERHQRFLQNPPPGAVNPKPILGYVDFYDPVKGFGFLEDAAGNSYFFTAKTIVNNVPLVAGEYVHFFVGVSAAAYGYRGAYSTQDRRTQGTRKPPVLSLRLTPERRGELHFSARSKASRYVICSCCGQSMTPRVVYWWGIFQGSICPFCGREYVAPSVTYTDFGSRTA